MMRCQDCGNQAKKECTYIRCRSCCRNRGFQCQTHVKSTWVPVSNRRPRLLSNNTMHHHQFHPLRISVEQQQQQQLQLQQQQQQQQQQPNPKRYRQHISSATAVSASSSGFEGGDHHNFPGEVSFPATFRCVRVRSDDDNTIDQYAYQTSVNIQGHIFKGILYDQGPASATHFQELNSFPTSFAPTTSGGIMLHQPHNLNPTTTSTTTYSAGAPFNLLSPGTQFFPFHKS